jgi:hypothetical protein
MNFDESGQASFWLCLSGNLDVTREATEEVKLYFMIGRTYYFFCICSKVCGIKMLPVVTRSVCE